MDILITIGLIILGVVLVIGIIRVITEQTTGFIDTLMSLFLLDWLGDALIWVIELLFSIND